MTSKKLGAASGKDKKLKLSKETLKDLDPKDKDVKGGFIQPVGGGLTPQHCGTNTCDTCLATQCGAVPNCRLSDIQC